MNIVHPDHLESTGDLIARAYGRGLLTLIMCFVAMCTGLHPIVVYGIAIAGTAFAVLCSRLHIGTVRRAWQFGLGFGIGLTFLPQLGTSASAVSAWNDDAFWAWLLLFGAMIGCMIIASLTWRLLMCTELAVIVSDDPCCSACGYCLTGNVSSRCPECGLEVAVEHGHGLHA